MDKRIRNILLLSLLASRAVATDWFVDASATGLNNGTSWANAWTNFGVRLMGGFGISAGDRIYVAGGQYPETVVIDIGGTSTNNPISILYSNRNSQVAWIDVVAGWGGAKYIVIDGAKTNGLEPYVTNTMTLRQDITNNMGIRIGGLVRTNVECVNWTSGNPGVKLRWLNLEQNNEGDIDAYGVALHRDTGVTYEGGEIAYCWIHRCSSTALNMNNGSSPDHHAVGVFKIHHTIIEDYGDAGIDGGAGCDIYNVIVGKSSSLNGHPGQFRITKPVRLYNSIFYDTYAGDPIVYTTYQQTNTGESFFYGNVFYNEYGWGLTNIGGVALALATEEYVEGMPQYWTNIFAINNTIICSNGLAYGIPMWNRHGPPDLSSPTGGIYITKMLLMNNIIENGAISLRSPAQWAWYGPTSVVVDYNNLSSISYDGTNYTPAEFNLAYYSTMRSNTTAIPQFLNRTAYDFRLTSALPGTNLSFLTNLCPDIDIDMTGRRRGNYAWDRGAYAYNVPDSSLIIDIDFADLQLPDVSGIIPDLTTNQHDFVLMGYDTNWPVRVTWTNGANPYWAHFQPDYGTWPPGGSGGGQYAVCTNLDKLTNMHAITVAAWLQYDQAPVGKDGNATILAASYGDNYINWRLGRDYALQTSFSLYTNLDYNTSASLHLNFLDPSSTTLHFYVATFNVTNQLMELYLDATNYTSQNFTGYCSYLTNFGCARTYSTGDFPGRQGYLMMGSEGHAGSPSIKDGDGFPNYAWYHGFAGRLRVWDRVLSTNEIWSLYQGGPTTPEQPTNPPTTCTFTLTNNTVFTNTFDTGMLVTLTAPSTMGEGTNFVRWLRDGADYLTNTSIDINLDTNKVFTVVYTNYTPVAYTIDITSEPFLGAMVQTTWDTNNSSLGFTPFTRYYLAGQEVFFNPFSYSQPTNFSKWLTNGVEVPLTNPPGFWFTADKDMTVTLVYVTNYVNYYRVTVHSLPDNGLQIYADTDINGFGTGLTPFDRYYVSYTQTGETVTFVAPYYSTFNWYTFDKWITDTPFVLRNEGFEIEVEPSANMDLYAVYTNAPFTGPRGNILRGKGRMKGESILK